MTVAIAVFVYATAMTLANLSVAAFGPWVSPINAFVLLGLLTDCAAVLRTIDPDDSDEAEKLAALLGAIDRAQAPSRHQGELL